MWEIPPGHPLRRMFAGLTEQAFLSRFGIADPPLVDYLSGLLSRFVHADAIHCLPSSHGRPLTSVAAMVHEAESLPDGGVTKREYLRHIGDVTLFWTGLFPESIERDPEGWGRHAVINYTNFGKRSYLLASQYEGRKYEDEAPLLRRLSHEIRGVCRGIEGSAAGLGADCERIDADDANSMTSRSESRGEAEFAFAGGAAAVTLNSMPDVSRLLDAAKAGDRRAAAELLPLVYDELRKLAAARMAAESPDQTLQPTALVHEAYLKLIGPADELRWDNRGHFFAAAAEAMRRILVDNARHKAAAKHGGGLGRLELDPDLAASREPREDLVALDEALDRLAAEDSLKAELVKLRYFAGLTLPEAAAALGLSDRTAGRHWAYARAWLRQAVEDGEEKS